MRAVAGRGKLPLWGFSSHSARRAGKIDDPLLCNHCHIVLYTIQQLFHNANSFIMRICYKLRAKTQFAPFTVL